LEENMNRLFSIVAGLMLIALGGLTLLSNMAVTVFGIDVARLVGGLVWSPLVIGLGLLLVMTPLLTRGHPALGGLFIPGMPVLATGVVMLLAAVLPGWHVWARLWPLLVLALAAGFIALALYQRNAWIVIPAIYIGLNGLVLQFCALTGWWASWAALWTVEPLAVGLTLLLTAAKTRSTATFVVGVVFCALSGAALATMMALVSGVGRLAGMFSAASLIFVGLAIIGWNLFSVRRPAPAGDRV
jgi:hypothetical protein